MSTADLLNTPIEFELGDLKLILHRLQDQDISELDLWIKAQVIKIAEHAITDDMSLTRQAAMRDAAMSKAMRTSWMSGDGRTMMASPDGLARIVFQADDSGASYEEIRPHMLNKANHKDVGDVLKELMPKIPEALKGKPKASQPVQSKPKRSKKK